MKAIRIVNLRLILLGLALVFVSTACENRRGTPPFPSTIEIRPAREIGQSFVADWRGLRSIEVFVTSLSAPAGPLELRLYENNVERRLVWEGEIEVPEDASPGWVRIDFPAQSGSASQAYFLALTTPTAGALAVSTGPEGSYLDGALHVNDRPIRQQLTFNLRYSALGISADVLGQLIKAVGILLVFAWAFTLPGWALFSAFFGEWKPTDLLTPVIAASAAGISIYPILILFAWLLGLHPGRLLVWLVPAGAIVYFGYRFRTGAWSPRFEIHRLDFGAGLLGVVLAAVLVSRAAPVQLLDAGMWGDSYQHTLITQLMIDRGGLFSSWEPFAGIVTFSYHFGFHTTAAVLGWLTGMPAVGSVVWTGQVFNFLAVAALAPLMRAVLKLSTAARMPEQSIAFSALVAVASAGLLFQMPGFYTNWGRYTQLAGQFLLTAWIPVMMRVYRARAAGWKFYLPAWILLAGIALTHYRVLIFAVLFLAAFLLIAFKEYGLWEMIVRTWWMSIGAALLFLPWFWHVYGGALMSIVAQQLRTTAADVGGPEAALALLPANLELYLPLVVWGAIPLILVYGLARRDRVVSLVGLWSLFLFMVANPAVFGLPGTGAINNFAVLIAAYIPAALLLGRSATWVAALSQGRYTFPTRVRPGVVAIACLLALLGSVYQHQLIRRESFALLTRPDLRAFEWIEENVATDAVFLVNMFDASAGNTVAGSDGGWWLPYFTGRQTTLPPFNFFSEKTKRADLRMQLLAIESLINAHRFDDRDFIERLESFRVSHVYLGQRQGLVNSNGQRMDPSVLQESEAFELIYNVDQVWIFEFVGKDG